MSVGHDLDWGMEYESDQIDAACWEHLGDVKHVSLRHVYDHGRDRVVLVGLGFSAFASRDIC